MIMPLKEKDKKNSHSDLTSKAGMDKSGPKDKLVRGYEQEVNMYTPSR